MRMYSQQEIESALYKLQFISSKHRECIIGVIENGNYGMDAEALINIVVDPEEYNIDYLNSVDSEVTEEFIELMERFGYIG